MSKGVDPINAINKPLTAEEIERVMLGHPHESTLMRKAEGKSISGSALEFDDNFVEQVTRSFKTAQGKDPYVTKLLNRMANLYAERNAVYKDNYLKVGEVMAAMFPHGKTLKTAEDFNRWHLFELAIVKLTRYANQYDEGGHADSIEDMIVYLAMVAGLDRAAKIEETS